MRIERQQPELFANWRLLKSAYTRVSYPQVCRVIFKMLTQERPYWIDP